ncbi:hypothetical protein FQR65_LT16511 [Abscondita terminalis]|nr:hypothetical protein FQR65_LT16511 [Abscondita terminalis]
MSALATGCTIGYMDGNNSYCRMGAPDISKILTSNSTDDRSNISGHSGLTNYRLTDFDDKELGTTRTSDLKLQILQTSLYPEPSTLALVLSQRMNEPVVLRIMYFT